MSIVVKHPDPAGWHVPGAIYIGGVRILRAYRNEQLIWAAQAGSPFGPVGPPVIAVRPGPVYNSITGDWSYSFTLTSLYGVARYLWYESTSATLVGVARGSLDPPRSIYRQAGHVLSFNEGVPAGRTRWIYVLGFSHGSVAIDEGPVTLSSNRIRIDAPAAP